VWVKLGLRIDVDTYRGTRLGVPALCGLLREYDIQATFFFSVGPDNMGRHLWRLVKPSFLLKMLRSNAPALYGWDILLRGTFFPGPLIGEKCAEEIRLTAKDGHEIGLHAWDHHAWQSQIDHMPTKAICKHLRRGLDQLTEICGAPPICSAVPGWKCTEAVLLEKEKFSFRFNSDCRGRTIFQPVVNGQTLQQTQIPVTLPTYDEIIGKNGITDSNYNEYLFSLIQPDQLNVLTIHAEVEGISRENLFRDFLESARKRKIKIVSLGEFLPAPLSKGTLQQGEILGREGWVAQEA
jgi:undecaprenyl phosphate-alpha-L-ara4FN deformylase